MTGTSITITTELTDAQAFAFAQFLKRVGLGDYRALASDQEEACTMMHAGEKVRRSLVECGYAPR